MPYPNFTRTVAELDQQWLFGPQAGLRYRDLLTAKFNAANNRPQIEAALDLGNFYLPSEANKHKRSAIRAVLLAKFLMASYPVGMRAPLKQTLAGLDLPSLKRAFANSFPALQDNGNRSAWRPVFLAPPDGLDTLKKARTAAGPNPAVPPFRFIIHGVADITNDVFDSPNILTNYEVLSMSLVGKENLHVHPRAPQGLILRVPENNILAAAPTDVAVQNYAPAFNAQNPNALTIAENLMDVATRQGGLNTPDFLMNNVRGYPYYNEVVVCGKAGIPLPHGITGRMTVVGVFIATDAQGKIKGGDDTAKLREMRAKACAVNYHLPMLYIPSSMASATL